MPLAGNSKNSKNFLQSARGEAAASAAHGVERWRAVPSAGTRDLERAGAAPLRSARVSRSGHVCDEVLPHRRTLCRLHRHPKAPVLSVIIYLPPSPLSLSICSFCLLDDLLSYSLYRCFKFQFYRISDVYLSPDEETMGARILSIRPPLVVENLLPCAIQYRLFSILESKDKEDKKVNQLL